MDITNQVVGCFVDSDETRHFYATPTASFSQITKTLDRLELSFARKLAAELTGARDALIEEVKRRPKRLNHRLPHLKDLRAAMADGLAAAWDAGGQSARGEVREFAEWDESKHPRRPAGDDKGGEFAPKGFTPADIVKMNSKDLRFHFGDTALRAKGAKKRGEVEFQKEQELAHELVKAEMVKRGMRLEASTPGIHRSDIGKSRRGNYSTFASADFTPRGAVEWLARRAFEAAGLLDDHLSADVKAVLVEALRTGAHMSTTVERIAEVFTPYLMSGAQDELLPEHRLRTIVRTNTTAAYNHGRLTEFVRPDLLPFMKGFRYSATIDSRTTEVCRLLHEKVFRPRDPALEELIPPNHFNCRGLIVPIGPGEEVSDAEWITPAEVAEAKTLAGDFLEGK